MSIPCTKICRSYSVDTPNRRRLRRVYGITRGLFFVVDLGKYTVRCMQVGLVLKLAMLYAASGAWDTVLEIRAEVW